MHFWKKAERVVAYKQQSQVEARKKEAMDKHLTFLVDQTQKYSSLLAQRLGDNNNSNNNNAQDAPPSSATKASPSPAPAAAAATLPTAPDQPAESKQNSAQAGPDGMQSERGLVKAEQSVPDQGGGPPAAAATAARQAPAAGSPAEQLSRGRKGSPELGSAFADGGAMDDEEDFQAGSASDLEDDEATLEEEEVRCPYLHGLSHTLLSLHTHFAYGHGGTSANDQKATTFTT